MAKGNMLLGYSRGKVGSLVFARRKGEQITRARNTAPANPRTRAQLAQRMKMYAPVKFYRQSLERFFKYAFTVAARETVFNAFMRENISIAPWTEKALVTAQAPVPYPARMSSGGVAALTAITSQNIVPNAAVGRVVVTDNLGSQNMATVALMVGIGVSDSVGEVSASLINANIGLRAGDQLTFVVVGTQGLSVNGNKVSYDGTSGFEFLHKQFVLEPNSEVTMTSLGFDFQPSEEGNAIALSLPFGGGSAACGGCVIVTRSNGGKIDASNTSLALNAYALNIYETMRSQEYRALAEVSYKASDDAVLNPATTAESQNA